MNNLEEQKKALELAIKRKDQVLKLQNNKEFKEIIVKGFCLEDCARCAKLSADSSIPEKDRELAMQTAQAAGALEIYLMSLVRLGTFAEDQLAEVEAEIVKDRMEDNDD